MQDVQHVTIGIPGRFVTVRRHDWRSADTLLPPLAAAIVRVGPKLAHAHMRATSGEDPSRNAASAPSAGKSA